MQPCDSSSQRAGSMCAARGTGPGVRCLLVQGVVRVEKVAAARGAPLCHSLGLQDGSAEAEGACVRRTAELHTVRWDARARTHRSGMRTVQGKAASTAARSSGATRTSAGHAHTSSPRARTNATNRWRVHADGERRAKCAGAARASTPTYIVVRWLRQGTPQDSVARVRGRHRRRQGHPRRDDNNDHGHDAHHRHNTG
jgi:hypothetical protein